MILNMKSEPTTAALSVRRFRERMRERGLVKKEVWVLPEHSAALSEIELRMREASETGILPATGSRGDAWSVETIAQALMETGCVQAGRITVEHMEGAEPSLRLTMHEHGDLPILLAVSGEQILAEVYLWPLSAVRDPHVFNAVALQTHKYLPLSNFSLSPMGDGGGYTLFGALDSRSNLESILLEIQALADNSIAVVELHAEHLKGAGE